MKRVLITGANSYIGTSFEKYMQEHYPDELQIDTVDLVDGSWREKDFSGYDVVLHVAAVVHKKETKENAELYYAVNCDLAVEVAKKAKAENVKQFIFLSTMSVYGMLKGRITKDTIPNPKNNYGKAKLQAETIIKGLECGAFKVCILRPPMIYGKGCKGNYQTLRKFALKMKLFPYVKNERSMLYIDNLSEFMRLIILNEENGTFFPQNGEYTNTSEMVKMIAAAHGKKLHLVKGFGWAVKFLGLFTRLVKKAFGSLTYDKEMSGFQDKYVKVLLRTTIDLSEDEQK